MPGRTVDVVAVGPPPLDPYEPAARAWGLAAALAENGDEVRVLHLSGSNADRVPSGVTALPIEIPLRRPGAPVESAEFATAAGHHLRKGVDLILRDPVGLGSLGLARRRRGPPVVGAFVRGVELRAFEGERRGRTSAGMVDRLDAWRDHRAVRRLERAALDETDRLFYDLPDVAKSLTEEYGVSSRKLLQLPPAVPALPALPTRAISRNDLRIPPDVPVVVAPTAFEAPELSGVDRVLEAFRRVRPFFPGVRLVLCGAPAPADPGVIVLTDRRGATLSSALASADLAIFASRVAAFDPGVVFAARAGVPSILLPGAPLPVDPAGAVRAAASDNPGDLASVLAEMLADPAMRREVGQAAARFAEAFLPARVAAALTEAIAPRAT